MVGYFWVSGYLSSRSYPQRWVLMVELALTSGVRKVGGMYSLFFEVFVDLGIVPDHLGECFDRAELN